MPRSFGVFVLLLLFGLGYGKLDQKTFANAMLKEYNFYRNLHGVPYVKLNESMSAKCKQYAEKLGTRNSVQPCLVHSRSNGENLMFYWNYKPVSEKELAAFTAKEFHDEIKFYNFKKPGFRVPAAHFTQMIWKTVKEIGIGLFERNLTRNSFGDCRVGTAAQASAYFVVIHHDPEGNNFAKDEFLKNVFTEMEKKPRNDHLDGRWNDTHTHFVTEASEKEPEVLFLGDDHIALLEQSKFFKDFLSPMHCVCFGIIGDRIGNLLWRIGNGELNSSTAKAIVVSIGGSDLDLNAKQLLDGLKEVATLLRSLRPNAQIYIMKLLPSGRKWNPRREAVLEVNSKLEDTLKGIATVIDCDMASLGPNDHIEPGMMFDFAHLTQEGYSKVFESVFNILNNLFSS